MDVGLVVVYKGYCSSQLDHDVKLTVAYEASLFSLSSLGYE